MFLGMFDLWRERVLGRSGGRSCQGIECQLGGELAVDAIVGVSRIRPWAALFSDWSICLGDIGDLRRFVKCFPVSCIQCRFYSSHSYSKSKLILSCF